MTERQLVWLRPSSLSGRHGVGWRNDRLGSVSWALVWDRNWDEPLVWDRTGPPLTPIRLRRIC